MTDPSTPEPSPPRHSAFSPLMSRRSTPAVTPTVDLSSHFYHGISVERKLDDNEIKLLAVRRLFIEYHGILPVWLY
jgi:hypothetical protein